MNTITRHQPISARPAVAFGSDSRISSLLALLTFSPCEAFLPIYVSGVRYGWHGFALLTAILSVGTVAGHGRFHRPRAHRHANRSNCAPLKNMRAA